MRTTILLLHEHVSRNRVRNRRRRGIPERGRTQRGQGIKGEKRWWLRQRSRMSRPQTKTLRTHLLVHWPGHWDLGIRRNGWDLIRMGRRKPYSFVTIPTKILRKIRKMPRPHLGWVQTQLRHIYLVYQRKGLLSHGSRWWLRCSKRRLQPLYHFTICFLSITHFSYL